MPDAVLVHQMRSIRPIDGRLKRDAAIFLLSLLALFGLFFAKYFDAFSAPFAVIFVVWLICVAATIDFCRHAWLEYVKPHFFDRK